MRRYIDNSLSGIRAQRAPLPQGSEAEGLGVEVFGAGDHVLRWRGALFESDGANRGIWLQALTVPYSEKILLQVFQFRCLPFLFKPGLFHVLFR